jgi:hypothetical protein
MALHRAQALGPRYSFVVKWALVRMALGGTLVACVAVGAFLAGRADAPKATSSRVDLRASPAVITAIHEVARLEATEFHVEKVVEISNEQSRLWGLITAKDALLLVAAGDVVAGVDLAKVRDEDIRIDAPSRTIHVRLPAPQIVVSTLDERATHVYARSTDMLAERNEALEGDARRAAEEQMRKAALDAGILDRARRSADRTLRALLRSLGYEEIELDWTDRG